jgi:hypothetical protein
MKHRLRHVANSSSSGFLVGLDSIPTTKEELSKILFRQLVDFDGPYIAAPDYYDDVSRIPTNGTILEIVLSDLSKGEATTEQILELLSSGWEYHDDVVRLFGEWPSHEKYSDMEQYDIDAVRAASALYLWLADKVGGLDTEAKYGDKHLVSVYNRFTPKENSFDPEALIRLSKHLIDAVSSSSLSEAAVKQFGPLPGWQKYLDRAAFGAAQNKYSKDSANYSKKRAKEDWQAIQLAHPNKHWFTLRYADEDGTVGSCLEHGGTFRYVVHRRISQH